MLLSLTIRDVLLIDRLDIAFAPGLTVLTGETGAGKSILLDSLGLALGERSEGGLIRPGAAQLSVAAEFQLPSSHAVADILTDLGFEVTDSLILRRVVGTDGRSRAFVNDQATSVAALRRLGDCLVEVHGQFENHALADASHHRALLDAYGQLDASPVAARWRAWRERRQARLEGESTKAKRLADADSLRQTVEELAALHPLPGEENTLASRRALLLQGEKLVEAINGAADILNRTGGVGESLRLARRTLDRVSDRAGGALDAILAALERAAVETEDARELIERLASSIDLDPASLEQVEQRLFGLRAVARKHGVAVDDLAALLDRCRRDLEGVDADGLTMEQLSAAEATARAAYRATASALSEARRAAAARFDAAVAAELGPLKLERASFRTVISPLPEDTWSVHGTDGIAFEVSTNPGMPPGPLAKIASGGERSRFMLALKVVLAASSAVPTLIFDEVDSGIGGAVAAAVGARLARLAEGLQVLVVTHSPQVAARGAHHWHVAKGIDAVGSAVTRVTALVGPSRQEEVARMLAGARVTDHARAAAESLLATAGGGDA